MAHIVYGPEVTGDIDYDVEEYCPFCDDMIPVKVDESCRPQIVCPTCDRVLELCSICDHKNCDWEEGKSCHVSREWEKENPL